MAGIWGKGLKSSRRLASARKVPRGFSDQPMPQKEGQTKKKAASIPAGREL